MKQKSDGQNPSAAKAESYKGTLSARLKSGSSQNPGRSLPEIQPAQFRIVLVSFLAAAIGLIAGLVAYALYKLMSAS